MTDPSVSIEKSLVKTDDVSSDDGRQLQVANPEDFTAIFRRFHAPLVRYARSITGSAAAAEDVVQDVFTKLWKDRMQIRVEVSLKALLYTMVRNRALNANRSERKIATDVSPGDADDRHRGEASSEAMTAAKEASMPFEDAEVFFEFNTTDNDLGLQIFLDAEGWNRVDVSDPDNHKIFQIHTQGALSHPGITELRFESAEPSPAEVLALFPPGEYEFRGKTVERTRLASTAELSHDFIAPFPFSPSDGAVVDPTNTTVTWDAPGAELVEVILENEDNDNLFDVIVEGEMGSLDIPPQFLDAGIEYKIELLAYHENGNRTIVESTFIAAP